MDNLCCASCSVPLQPEDGHDMCPPCLGVDHLREALSDHACSNCSVLPRAVWWPGCPWWSSLLTGRSLSSGIRCRMDRLRPRRSGPLRMCLRRLGGEPSVAGPRDCPLEPFWNWAPGPQVRAPVPLREVQGNRCLRLLERLWAVCSWMFPQPRAACLLDGHEGFFPPTADGRALAAMHEAPKFGLGCMPPVESAIAAFTVPPDEVLRPNAHCPRTQCRVTGDLLCKAYNSGARMGRIGNSLSHLMLGLSSSLEPVPLDQSTQGLSDASLQGFALMTRELGCTLYMLVHAQRQQWLAQSSLTKPCRRTPRVLPVVLGELFGSAALEALECTAQASRTQASCCWGSWGLVAGFLPPSCPFLGVNEHGS
ncbi:hypothetical protein GOODEAATRI_023882 [Goodea atripinnis]|uniref:Uncharacterized protein n=1 Tax=Goodea atripinnis TaxID=208336 RepID=A0ABV0MUM9_9TELE